MNWFYRHFIRPVLFAQDPEDIHRFTVNMLSWVGRHELAANAMSSFLGAPELPTTVFGLRFPNPIGLAAGMDKEGNAVAAWEAMGFGHCELGAVTWLAQPGNPAPRLFRVIPEQAIINRMGFNNEGALAMARHLQQWKNIQRWPNHPVGINLGKSKITPLDEAAQDYAKSFEALWTYGDFFVVNVSSPNTPDLRKLQDKSALDEILAALQAVNEKMSSQGGAVKSCHSTDVRGHNHVSHGAGKPIIVKVAPDLEFQALDDILDLVQKRQIAGLMATNTTISRPQSDQPDVKRIYSETGGLSGKPLRQRSTEVIRHLHQQTRGLVPIIGVGGIATAEDAWEKITAGACLLQIYTSLIYEGPGLVRSLVKGLQQKLGENGMQHLSQAVGYNAGK